LDYYSYVRGAYLQRRRSLIYDGDPPRERDEDRSSGPGPDAGKAAQAEASRQAAQDASEFLARQITAGSVSDDATAPNKDSQAAPGIPVGMRATAATTKLGP
jgi:hypothetical protein